MLRQCTGTTKAGKRCSAVALPDSEFCISHDPTRVVELAAYREKGGQGRSHENRAKKSLKGTYQDMAALKGRLITALEKVEGGALEPGQANAMANLARAIVTVAGVADFEGQLTEMRKEIVSLQERRGAS